VSECKSGLLLLRLVHFVPLEQNFVGRGTQFLVLKEVLVQVIGGSVVLGLAYFGEDLIILELEACSLVNETLQL